MAYMVLQGHRRYGQVVQLIPLRDNRSYHLKRHESLHQHSGCHWREPFFSAASWAFFSVCLAQGWGNDYLSWLFNVRMREFCLTAQQAVIFPPVRLAQPSSTWGWLSTRIFMKWPNMQRNANHAVRDRTRQCISGVYAPLNIIDHAKSGSKHITP